MKKSDINILVACEESQTVCKAFRDLGYTAYSSDIQSCSGGHPEWHITGDALKVINPIGGGISFETDDGAKHIVKRWNLLIAHPPCTYLSNVATRAFSLKATPAEKVVERWAERAKAAVFFMQFMLADCDYIAVENPVGFMTTAYKKPDQYINPWMWASGTDDTENYHAKKTGLWLKGLPMLTGNGNFNSFSCEIYGKYENGKNKTWEDSFSRSAKARSKTFPGVAQAMAEQWGDFISERMNHENSTD